MKAVFLARNVIPGPGKTRVVLVDVNAGVGNSDFRAGGNNGDIALDFYGDIPDITPGQAYELDIAPFVAPDEQADQQADTSTDTPAPEAESNVVEFNGKVTITKNYNGFSLVMVEKDDDDDDDENNAATTEGSDATNTQDNAALSDTAVGANAATGTIAPGDGTVLPDTPTGNDNTANQDGNNVATGTGEPSNNTNNVLGEATTDTTGTTGAAISDINQPGSDSQTQGNISTPLPDTQDQPGASTGDNK
ncbi:MAG: hypothetical protein ACXVJE_19345 [Mucilaginibacter sp.]